MRILILFITLLSLNAFSRNREDVFPDDLNDPQECQTFIDSIKNDFEYHWIKTDESPNSQRKLSIFYYFRKNTELINPVLFFNGGPGYSSHGSYLNLEQNRFYSSKIINFIYMDQRGTGCSSRNPIGIGDAVLEPLMYSGSIGIVRDAEAIRKKVLGVNSQWKIFGQSFGAFIVHRYILDFPDSIKEAHAHGFAIGLSDFELNYNRIVGQNRVLSLYLKKYPMDEIRLRLFQIYLSAPDRCFTKSNGLKYCGFELLSPLVNKMGFINEWEIIHQWLVSLVTTRIVNESVVQDFTENFFTVSASYQNAQLIQTEDFMQIDVSLNFIGVFDRESHPLDYNVCNQIYQKIKIINKNFNSELSFDECAAPYQFKYMDPLFDLLNNRTQARNNFILMSDFVGVLKKYKVPFYLYSGEYDPYIPKENFSKEVLALGRMVKYTHFLKSGHEGFFTETAIFNKLAQ